MTRVITKDKSLEGKRKYHEEMTNGTESNVSQLHLAGEAVIRQILPVGGEDRSSLDYSSIA